MPKTSDIALTRLETLARSLIGMHFLLLHRICPDPAPEVEVVLMQETIRIATERLHKAQQKLAGIIT